MQIFNVIILASFLTALGPEIYGVRIITNKRKISKKNTIFSFDCLGTIYFSFWVVIHVESETFHLKTTNKLTLTTKRLLSCLMLNLFTEMNFLFVQQIDFLSLQRASQNATEDLSFSTQVWSYCSVLFQISSQLLLFYNSFNLSSAKSELVNVSL